MATHPQPRRRGRPNAAAAVNIPVRIIAVAKRLFFEHGISAVSMETIANEADITKQTLYARFPNKNELCLAVINSEIAQWREQQGPLLEGFTTLEEALYQHSVKTLETATLEASVLLDRFLTTQSGSNPALAKEIIAPIRTRAIQDIALILDRFSSTAAPDISAAAEYYFICLSGKIQDMNTFRDEVNAQAIAAWARTAVQLFINGYLARPATT